MVNPISAVWEKRQMGNVLLIIILGIRIFLAELSPSKVHFTENKQPSAGREWILVEYDYFKRCWPAWPASRRFSVKWTLLELSSAKQNRMPKIMISKTFPIWRFSKTALV